MIAFLGTGENNVGNTEKKIGRGEKALLPSVKEFCRLCGCYFKVQYGSQTRHIGTESLFQPSKQKDSIDVVLGNLCENVGLTVKQSESKSDRVSKACGRKIRTLDHLYSFIASTLFNDDQETASRGEDRFKRCLPTSASSPERSPMIIKVQRKNNELSAAQKREGEAEGDGELGGKRKRNSLRKSLFCMAADKREETGEESKENDSGEWELGLLNVDDLIGDKNDTRVKVLISYASGHVEVRSPQEKKSIAIIKNMALKHWNAVANVIFDHVELRKELPVALKRNVSAEFREYCRSDSVLKGTDPDQLSSFSNHLFLREIAIFYPLWDASVTGAASGERKNATNPMALSTAVVARCRNPLMSAVAYRISMILFHSAARHVDFQRLNRLGICMCASMTVALQRKMGANYDSKVLAWKKRKSRKTRPQFAF